MIGLGPEYHFNYRGGSRILVTPKQGSQRHRGAQDQEAHRPAHPTLPSTDRHSLARTVPAEVFIASDLAARLLRPGSGGGL